MIVLDRDGSIGRWLCDRTGGEYSSQSLSLGNIIAGKLTAAVMFDNYNVASICIHVAGEGRWMTREFLRETFSYPFEFLKVKKLIGLVDSTNEQAKRLDEHLGFVLEARIADAAPKGDLLIYTMNRAQCRFLSEKYRGLRKQNAA